MHRFVFFAFVAACYSMKIDFLNCPTPKSSAHVSSVSIEPCDKKPCPLHRGGNAAISINFTTTQAHEKLSSKVSGKIGPAWIPFSIQHPDACVNQGVHCPIAANQQLSFNYSLPVSSSYPAISVVVSWELRDENSKEIVCIEFPTHLV